MIKRYAAFHISKWSATKNKLLRITPITFPNRFLIIVYVNPRLNTSSDNGAKKIAENDRIKKTTLSFDFLSILTTIWSWSLPKKYAIAEIIAISSAPTSKPIKMFLMK